jgi:serine/threonine protein kinase
MNSSPEELLFALALTKPAQDRAAWLDRECAGDPALRARLEALLAAHEQTCPALDNPPPAGRPTLKLDLTDAPDDAIGQRIGRYKLLEKVGEGGCGVVYVAEQTEPVRRRVALKVIKLGMDTKAVVARFEAERQALALMDHPNIAKVLDAGMTEEPDSSAGCQPAVSPTGSRRSDSSIRAGRPYFVMELVRGIKITDYCDQARCSTKERLELFIKVCHAIQHAHQKGIIHRDIKPSNILVTLHDGVPVPKVIDFGIAKATEGRLTDATVYTQLHQFIGTPAYMSPEQAEMSGLDVDTRSDIYSLGVLLYELLPGSTPFDARELMSQGLDAMRQTIREKDPVRPSTRLATLPGEELTTAAKRRGAEAPRLIHQLKGDLDWIVMKCLEKDRSRRYDTANGLAMDLERHLNNEPVVARPPSAAYRFQKAWRRNKLAFSAATAVTVALVAGISISLWQTARATRERNKAVEAEMRETAQRKAAEAAQAEANHQRDLAQVRLFDSLVREMRSISTIRPLGYRKDLQDRVRLALELPQSALRRDELRAEFTQGLGDPFGMAPVEVMWEPALELRDRVEMSLSPDGELAAILRNGQTLVIRETRTGKSVAVFGTPGPLLPESMVFSADGRALYGIVRIAEDVAFPESGHPRNRPVDAAAPARRAFFDLHLQPSVQPGRLPAGGGQPRGATGQSLRRDQRAPSLFFAGRNERDLVAGVASGWQTSGRRARKRRHLDLEPARSGSGHCRGRPRP